MKKNKFHHRINIKILTALFFLFTVAALAVSIVNLLNIRGIYEKNFTERALLSNNLIASLIDGEDLKYYVNLMQNQDDAFKERQAQFHRDRNELVRLQKKGAPEEEQAAVVARLESFHRDMSVFKTDKYWQALEELKQLKEVSRSKYVYVVAYTGVRDSDGTKLITYIFDAEDSGAYSSIDGDGLGTVSDGEAIIYEIYETKKPMDQVLYHNDAPYGELYFAYAPVLDGEGNVIALLGADLDLGEMHEGIKKSMLSFTAALLAFAAAIILFIYVFLRRRVIGPLRELTVTAQKLSEGDVYASVPSTALKQKSELGILAHAIDDMSGVYQSMIKNTGELFEAANAGRLDIRNDASKYKGDIKKVIEQINDTLDVTTMYLNNVPEGILIMSKNFDIHFRNRQHINFFGDMPAADLITVMFAQENENTAAPLRRRLEEALRQENYSITVWIEYRCFSVALKEIRLKNTAENSVMVIAVDITDLMQEKENAQEAAKAKSAFLSRMSHEMRTPMNAIIGMTKIADGTDDLSKLKYCISAISTSSKQLLGIINDVLDMSKIEAGKFELEYAPMNIEKLLMKTCNLVIDNMEKKNQKFNVTLGKGLCLHYIGDELKLSQVVTNILSNAMKFTPEGGKITLTVEEIRRDDTSSTLRFSISDTGIGMTEEQIGRLFHSFEQADGSISRRFGGTGLGLAISKNIVEKMGGRIWTESKYGSGSVFHFEVQLERAPHQNTVIFDGIRPADLSLLIVENDAEIRKYFLSIVEGFGIRSDAASNPEEAFRLVEAAYKNNRTYDMIFLDYDTPGINGLDIARRINGRIDKNTVIVITSFLEWYQIEEEARQININRFITKPLFPSAILDAINDVVGRTLKTLDMNADMPSTAPDLSRIHILLAEDMEINREIFTALLAKTQISIDTAENGLRAVAKFQENPEKYDLIIMDIQMPEMNGYEATQTIRGMDLPRAKSIPIIAMTANAFKEDIERCLASGMNDHLSKPIDEQTVIEKIRHYVG